MKMFLFVCSLFFASSAVAQEATQLVINVKKEDFKPERNVGWTVTAGATNLNMTYDSTERTGSGLGVGIEKMLNENWDLGAHYASVRANEVYRQEGLPEISTTSSLHVANAYGKYSFVNYPLNRWNLLRVSVLGGAMIVNQAPQAAKLIYGAAISYNYDNTIGIELNTKLTPSTTTTTSANIIGYF